MMVVRVTIEIVAMIIKIMVNGEQEKEKVLKMGNTLIKINMTFSPGPIGG